MKYAILMGLVVALAALCLILFYMQRRAETSVRKLTTQIVNGEIGVLLSSKGLASELRGGDTAAALEALEAWIDTTVCALHEHAKRSQPLVRSQITEALRAVKRYRASAITRPAQEGQRNEDYATSVEMRGRAQRVLDDVSDSK